MAVEGYLNEIIHQIAYKLHEIKFIIEVRFPEEIHKIIKIFTSQYEIKIDKIAIVNEIDRKLMVDDSFTNRSVSWSPLVPPRTKSKPQFKKAGGRKNKLTIPLGKKAIKKATSSIGKRNKNIKSDSSGKNSFSIEDHSGKANKKILHNTLKKNDLRTPILDQFRMENVK